RFANICAGGLCQVHRLADLGSHLPISADEPVVKAQATELLFHLQHVDRRVRVILQNGVQAFAQGGDEVCPAIPMFEPPSKWLRKYAWKFVRQSVQTCAGLGHVSLRLTFWKGRSQPRGSGKAGCDLFSSYMVEIRW